MVTGGSKMENLLPSNLGDSESKVQVKAYTKPSGLTSKPSTELHPSSYHEGLELKHSFGASI